MKFALPVLVASVVVAGCMKSVPPEELTLKAATDAAKAAAIQGVQVPSDFKRVNGYEDPANQKLYRVEYSYTLGLADDFENIVLAQAKRWRSEDAAKSGFFAEFEFMQQDAIVLEWMKREQAKERMKTLLRRCPQCKAWIEEDGDVERGNRLRDFVLAWKTYEEMGYKDDTKKGQGLPMTVIIAMMKSENGWVPTK